MSILRSYNRHFLTGTGIIAAVYLAQNMLSFALPLLALEMSGTGAGFALITGAGFVPNILFAIFVGVINDRMRKATGFRAYSLLLALSCGLLWVLMITDLVNLAALAVFMIALNLLGYAIGNLQFTLLRLTVPHTHLSDATALSSAINSTISTVGPALGGLALYLIGGTGLVGLVTLLLIASMCAAYTVTPEEPTPHSTPFWPSLSEGFRVFARNRELVMMTVAVVLTNAAAGAFTVAMILKLKTDFAANDFQVGLVAAIGGLGSIFASGYAPRLRRWLGYRAAFYWPIWVLALICLAGAGAPALWMLFVISLCEGAFSIFYAIGVWSYRQESTEAAHMGRVAGITGAIFKLLMPPVIFLAGVLTDAEAVAAAFWLAAGLNLGAAVFLSTVAGWGLPRRTAAA